MTTVDDFCRLFFLLFFDEFDFFDLPEKGYWARCFGKTFWVVREGPGKTGFIFRSFRKNMLDQVLRKSLLRVTTVDDRCRLFFRLFSTSSTFSIFPKKVIGPDVSENCTLQRFYSCALARCVSESKCKQFSIHYMSN